MFTLLLLETALIGPEITNTEVRLRAVISVAPHLLSRLILGLVARGGCCSTKSRQRHYRVAEIKHDKQLSFRAADQRCTHPLQAGNIHFIITSPGTARQALML